MACDAQGISVGIDAERVQTPSDTLREATLSSEEARLLPREGDPDAWFFRVWAAKEAVGKALGTGVVPDPKHFGVQRVDPESGAVELRTEAGMATAMTFEHRSKVNEENYALAVCQWVTGEV